MSMGSDATEGADILAVELAAVIVVVEVVRDAGVEIGTMRFLTKPSVPLMSVAENEV